MLGRLKTQVRMPNTNKYIRQGETLEIIAEMNEYYICKYESYILQIPSSNVEVVYEK